MEPRWLPPKSGPREVGLWLRYLDGYGYQAVHVVEVHSDKSFTDTPFPFGFEPEKEDFQYFGVIPEKNEAASGI